MDDQLEESRGVSSLKSRFEALARENPSTEVPLPKQSLTAKSPGPSPNVSQPYSSQQNPPQKQALKQSQTSSTEKNRQEESAQATQAVEQEKNANDSEHSSGSTYYTSEDEEAPNETDKLPPRPPVPSTNETATNETATSSSRRRPAPPPPSASKNRVASSKTRLEQQPPEISVNLHPSSDTGHPPSAMPRSYSVAEPRVKHDAGLNIDSARSMSVSSPVKSTKSLSSPSVSDPALMGNGKPRRTPPPPPVPARVPSQSSLNFATSEENLSPPPIPNRPPIPNASSSPSRPLLPPPPPPPFTRNFSPSTPPQVLEISRSQSPVDLTSENSLSNNTNGNNISSSNENSTTFLPLPPPIRSQILNRTAPAPPTTTSSTNLSSSMDSSESDNDEDDLPSTFMKRADDLPDSTFASRRSPVLAGRVGAHSHSHLTCSAVRGNYIVMGSHHHGIIRIYAADTGAVVGSVTTPTETKVTSLAFKCAPQRSLNNEDFYHFWAGTKDGSIFEIDARVSMVTSSKLSAHSSPVTGIWGVFTPGYPRRMISLDDSGRLAIWTEDANINSPPRVQRLVVPIGPNDSSSSSASFSSVFVSVIGHQVWTASRAQPGGKGPYIRAYDVSGDPKSSFTINTRSSCLPTSNNGSSTTPPGGPVGSVTAASLLPSDPQHVYLAHESGHVSVWNRTTISCVKVVKISSYNITTLTGVNDTLWAGYRTGFVYVYKPHLNTEKDIPWKVLKTWRAHTDAVAYLGLDLTALQEFSQMHVVSAGVEGAVNIWDGFLREDWIEEEMYKRENAYCTHRPIRLLICTWNVDARKPTSLTNQITNMEFLQNLLQSVNSPDIIVFGFQELIDLENKKLTAKSMLLGKKRADSKFNEQVSHHYKLWYDKLVQAVRLAMPPETPYSVVHTENLVGLFTCIFVKNSEVRGLGDVNITKVKTGMGGLHGNKGAILARFVIDDSSLCFVNCHLAAGQAHKRQRNNDLVEILEKSSLSENLSKLPYAYLNGSGGTQVFDHELVFLNGDLNYRIDVPREVAVSAVKGNDLTVLLEKDQLLKEMGTNHSFRLRSFQEGPIAFAPTYKYDPGTDQYDSSEKKRIPAWCDRILWRCAPSDIERVKQTFYARHEVNVSDHRPVSAGFEVLIRKVIPEKRLKVYEQIESQWYGVQQQKLTESLEFWRLFYAC